MMTDEELMKSYQLGDTKAVSALYDRYAPKIMRYLTGKSINKIDAEDIIQKAFIKFHQCRLDYSEKYPVSAWIFTIVRSAFLDHLRIDKKWANSVSLEKNNEHLAPINKSESETPDLKGLSENEKELIQSRYLNDETYESIAKKQGVSVVAARKKVNRALSKLKTIFMKGRYES